MRAWIVFLLLAPLGAAQGHDHGDSHVVITSDVGPDGRAFVGSPTHFDLIAFGDDLVPDFHVDLPVRVTLDGAVLYQTNTVAGHDYDGVHGFAITFPRAGPWRVEVPGTDAFLEGEAIEVPLQPAEVTGFIAQSSPPQIELSAGANHTDFLIEYFDGGQTILRTKVHSHGNHVSFTEGRISDQTLTQRVTAFTAAPEQGDPIRPATRDIPRDTSNFGITSIPVEPIQQEANAAVVVPGDWTLVGTFDPFTTVTPDTLQHLQALVVDADRNLVRHITYEVTFRGPHGLIFAATDGQIHEHDGVYELAARMATPGQYVADIRAVKGDWSASMQMQYLVRPNNPWQGPIQLEIQPAPGNTTQEVRIVGTMGDGGPFAHGEVELRLGDITGAVHLRDKLHTHGDGVFTALLPLPCAQNHIALDPLSLDRTVLEAPVSRLSITAELGHGDCRPRWLDADFGTELVPETVPQDEEAPAAPAALLLIGLAIALRARQR